jgi:glycosyltransferase involved in cell wall biosynthesis
MLKKPFFSIVIPTLNEEKCLPILLDNLKDQTYQDFEVIHVDGDSDDLTVSLAKKHSKKIKIKSFGVKKRNVSFQRNFGAQKSRGQWVIFMDADTQIPAYFLDGIRYQLAKNPKTGVFTTWIKVNDQDAKIYQAVEKSINFGFELFKSIGQEAAFGAMIGSHSSLLKKVSFEEDQKVYEDSRFLHQATQAGYVYSIFREPRYIYSLRRFKKEGNLKMASSVGMLVLQYLRGADFSTQNYGYEMKGGGYYDIDDAPIDAPIFTRLNNYLKKASENQLQHARNLLNSLKDI